MSSRERKNTERMKWINLRKDLRQHYSLSWWWDPTIGFVGSAERHLIENESFVLEDVPPQRAASERTETADQLANPISNMRDWFSAMWHRSNDSIVWRLSKLRRGCNYLWKTKCTRRTLDLLGSCPNVIVLGPKKPREIWLQCDRSVLFLAGTTATQATEVPWPGGSVRGERANFTGLVLGCIEASKQASKYVPSHPAKVCK